MKKLIRKILKEEVVRKKIHMDLPNSVLKMNQIFKENGYELYVVGGAVRDLLYGNEPKDFDLATNAKPEEIKSMLNMYRTIELGEQFGIVNVITEDGQYEIATFRRDLSFKDKSMSSFLVYLKTLNNGSYELFLEKLKMK
jgi:tRNA nucleotidyltransferase (CCA-adding enzyme)